MNYHRSDEWKQLTPDTQKLRRREVPALLRRLGTGGKAATSTIPIVFTSSSDPATLCDHQFGLLNGAQFLPIDDDRNVARSMTELDSRTSFDQVISRRCLGREISPSVLVATHTPASASWNASNDRVRRLSVMVEIPRQVQSVCSFAARSLDRFADMLAILSGSPNEK